MALRLHVTFPDCWDCRRLDSLGHKSHAAYSTRAVCPASHPVAIPRISLIYTYSVTGGPGVSLAPGNQNSAHGTSSTRGTPPSSSGSSAAA
jgi:Domain of unknown function (DUF1996)